MVEESDKEFEARMAERNAEIRVYRAKAAARRKLARDHAPLREALLEWVSQGWTCVALAADYLRQHSAGGMSSPYWTLSKKDQATVVRSVLEGLRGENLVVRAWGPGDRKSEVHTYILKTLVSKEGHA